MPNDHVVGLTTTSTEEEANKLGHELVDARLAACVQVTSPIRAIYRWQARSATSRNGSCGSRPQPTRSTRSAPGCPTTTAPRNPS